MHQTGFRLVMIGLVVSLVGLAFPQLGSAGETYGITPWPRSPDACITPPHSGRLVHRHGFDYGPDALCNEDRSGAAQAAKQVVQQYWNMPYSGRYPLFSAHYKGLLKSVYKINNKAEYSRNIDPERSFDKQVYERIEVAGDRVNITVLTSWFQEGYMGVKSVFFHLIKEGGVWKINEVME